ncbi:AbrB family transcriptional regulator [Planococcus salinarum]|uniref:AbrB family transcriptional regulator n=1 Tax=Planococcus salinarum TaxID=622695 RepID=A0ABX3CZ52_9BACL|nr:AbrB family transcriptional regulator [Planococcus salinarum]OHX50570.1 AbrB family transcriptional regulator [Planococcus salinarum]
MKLLRTALVAVAAGFLFQQIGMFLPWLLGPMIALLLLRQFTEMEFYWPKVFRAIGLVLLGIMIGASFTRESVLLMWVDLPYMLFMTVSVIIAALLFGLLFSRMANESLQTSLLGSMPGGLSQMVLISEEVDNANVTVVSVMQTFRIFLVVTIVPLLTTFFVGREASQIATETAFSFSPPAFLVAVALGIFAYLLMKKFSFPAKELLAPVLVMAIVQSVTGTTLIEMPEILVILAQLLVGAHLGLQMEKLRENMSMRLAFAIVVNNVLLIAFTVFIAYILAALLPEYLFLDFFLSAAPGGMAEMGITALAAGADVALITSFHLFRLFFILLLAAPLVAYMLKKLDAKTGN